MPKKAKMRGFACLALQKLWEASDAHAKAELRASGLAPICLALLDAEQATRGFLGPAKEKPLRAALGQIAHGADAASPVQLV